MAAVTDGAGISGIGQIALTVGDLARAVAFYRDVLGLRFLFEAPPAMAFFDCGGIRLMLSLPEAAGADPGRQYHSIVYYAVEDIHGAARAAWSSNRRRTSSPGCRTRTCGWDFSAIRISTCWRS